MSLKDPKNQKLLNDFLAEHGPLIHKHINILQSKGQIPSNVDPEDLHFAGFHGLMDALHKYQHDVAARKMMESGENPFAKYAEQRIKGKMLDHIASQDEAGRSNRKRLQRLEEVQAATPPQPPIKPEE